MRSSLEMIPFLELLKKNKKKLLKEKEKAVKEAVKNPQLKKKTKKKKEPLKNLIKHNFHGLELMVTQNPYHNGSVN